MNVWRTSKSWCNRHRRRSVQKLPTTWCMRASIATLLRALAASRIATGCWDAPPRRKRKPSSKPPNATANNVRCRSGRPAAIRAASGAPAGSGGFFLADVEGLVDAGDDVALFVDDLHRPLGQVLVAVGGGAANFLQHVFSEGKGGAHRALAGLDEINMRRLVPDNIVAAQVVHQQQHPERIYHAVQRSAEMGTDIIGVVPVQLHLDTQVTKILAQLALPYSGADIGAEYAQAAAHASGTTEELFQYAHRFGSRAFSAFCRRSRMPPARPLSSTALASANS